MEGKVSINGSDGTSLRGIERCSWGNSAEDYAAYHDVEWGRPVLDDRVLFEKLCLEGFQSGLSWLTILRKRPAFREVFANFDAHTVAGYGPADIERLLQDARIIRHRGKISATITNAQALLDLYEQNRTLAQLIWGYRPEDETPRRTMAEVPSVTPESRALATELKRFGFRFVGPTTAYAAMQAMGVVNDHLTSCFCYDECRQSQHDASETIKALKT